MLFIQAVPLQMNTVLQFTKTSTTRLLIKVNSSNHHQFFFLLFALIADETSQEQQETFYSTPDAIMENMFPVVVEEQTNGIPNSIISFSCLLVIRIFK